MASINTSIKGWTQGVDLKQVLSGAAGLGVATMVPGYIVKIPAGTTPTTTQKMLKTGASLGLAIVTGMAMSKVAGKEAGKAAFVGGVAGTVLQAFNVFVPGVLPPLGAANGPAMISRPVRETIPIMPGYQRADEQVQLIRP